MSNIGNKEVMSKNLKYYIEKSGKDRRELSEIWGFPYSTVSEWVNGRKYPRIDRIEIMADYFGILKSDLIEEHSEEEQKNKSVIMLDELKCLSDAQIKLFDFVKSVPDDKAEMVLRVVKSIVEAD